MTYRVCIIVDNPLRDLDGLVLVAWHLANMEVDVYLVPMYTQVSDVRAISPNLVLVNYSRRNNINILRIYKSWGILVGVLDTEGVSGKDVDGLAQFVKKVKIKDVVDLYCLWGPGQYLSFIRHGILPESKINVTGCPRYDFCTKELVQTLPKVDLIDYVLVNTSFPAVNPRFTQGPEEEIKTIMRLGFNEDLARQGVYDAKIAYQNVVNVVTKLAHRFPSQNFVVRPHPFEAIDAYSELNKEKNVFVRQQGTSLEWINSSICLIHLNCTTSIEAAMLGKSALSLEWLNTSTLSVPIAKKMSMEMDNEENLYRALSSIIQKGRTNVAINPAQQKIIDEMYAGNDGNSAKRVASCVLSVIKERSLSSFALRKTIIGLSSYSLITLLFRFLGYNKYIFLRGLIKGNSDLSVKNNKFFSKNDVNNILGRIGISLGGVPITTSEELLSTKHKRLYSGKCIRIIKEREDINVK